MDVICGHFNHTYNGTLPRWDDQLYPGSVAGACVIFFGVLPFVLFNFRFLPLGSTGALLAGSVLMVVSSISDQTQVYHALGNPGNLRAVFMTLGIMTFAQYFQRENLMDYLVKRVLDRPIGFVPFLFRATAVTFIGTGLLSQDATSTLLAPRILRIWQSRRRPVMELETLLLGISTSTNIASALTVYASVPIALISAKASKEALFKLDMSVCLTYLALPAVVGYAINIVALIAFSKVATGRYHLAREDDAIIELGGVEDALITQNAILDNSVADLHHKPRIRISQPNSAHCERTKVKKPGGGGGGGGGEDGEGEGGRGDLHNANNVDLACNLSKLSIGDTDDKGIHGLGPPTIFLDKNDDLGVNKDQCHSLYNLDKIGYITVSERFGKFPLELPRTVSFYHSFSDMDSWQYTRENIMKRFEQDRPKNLPDTAFSLTRRQMSSRGLLESVQFSTSFKHKLPRHRLTSVWQKGLMTDALRMSSKAGIYRAFSGASPSVSFLTTDGDDHARFADIISREFKPSNSRCFQLFLVVVFCCMFALYCVPSEHIHIDIGLLPVAAVTLVMVVDAGWNRRNCIWMLRRLDWSVIVTYLGLFTFVRAFTSSNIPLWLWHRVGLMGNAFDDARSIAVLTILVIALSNTIGAVPLTLIVVDLLPECSARYPLFLYLAWGMAMSGNITLHGASCSLVIAKKAEDIVQYKLSYWQYARYALPSSCLILAVGTAIIYGMIRLGP